VNPASDVIARRLFLFALLVCPVLVYLPGLDGPFLFDDYPNIVGNEFIKISSLDVQSLMASAFSMESGALRRPVAMLSFALNYYFAETVDRALPFKVTNLAVHVCTALIVFALIRLVLFRAFAVHRDNEWNGALAVSRVTLLAGAVALWWAIHPIQLTTVLYVVQRMAGLSGLFSLLALYCYMCARSAMIDARMKRAALLFFATMVSMAIALFSKENAILVPVFALLLEWLLFQHPKLQRWWGSASSKVRTLFWAVLLVLVAIAAYLVLDFAQAGYVYRSFTLTERVLTEARVLVMYLFLILVPRISGFGLYHDDIIVSQSLISPSTTILAFALIIVLLVVAVAARRRHPVLTLGIAWFFVAHSLESTVLALELVHEHRNYVASIGPLLVVGYGIELLTRLRPLRLLSVVVCTLALALGLSTATRAAGWADLHSLSAIEVIYHPRSARAHVQHAASLFQQKHFVASIEALERAIELDPREPGYQLMQHLNAAYIGQSLGPAAIQRTLETLDSPRKTVLTDGTLRTIAACLKSQCRILVTPMESWLRTVMAARAGSDLSVHHHFLGQTLLAQSRAEEAITELQRSIEIDPLFLHPRFELVHALLGVGRVEEASRSFRSLVQANDRSQYRRDVQLEQLRQALAGS